MNDDLHDTANWEIGAVLRHRARSHGEKIWIQTVAGETLTYQDAEAQANQVACLLMARGVAIGDNVALFLPNNMDFCRAWLGIAKAGAVMVAVNTEYKGTFLQHVLTNCQAQVLICDAHYLERVVELENELPDLQTVLVPGFTGDNPFRRVQCTAFDQYREQSPKDPLLPVCYRDTACIMYTSGTTGPSKGVLMPHAHLYLFGLGTIEHMELTEADCFYIVLPLFHANGLFMQLYATLIIGASAVIRERFSASEWLNDVRHYGATITNMLGVVSAFVINQPPTEHDRNHRVRAIGVAPNPAEQEQALRERFGVREVFGLYGMTEVNIPLYTVAGVSRPGSCGKNWDRYYELRIVDPDTDEEVPAGEAGEIVVRPRQPFGFMSGYNRMPEKTVEAWRNFWFHTGDAAFRDEDGYVYFVDRIKDCIRRRGENISSFEVESAIAAHPAVADVAAIAVPSEIRGGEDEVMVIVVLQTDSQLSPESLIDYCEARMPRFAVPRFVEFAESLPKTPTNKVQKHLLRAAGVTAATWDRQRAK